MHKRFIASLAAFAIVLTMSGCTKTEASDSKQLAAATERIDELEKKVEELSDKLEDVDFDFDEDVHEIYDDTAVVEAYKSGDDSALTDEKDKYIYEQLKEAVDEIITDGMTDYEKEKAVYTYIFENTNFDNASLSAIDTSDEYSHTPYGFFHDHTTICVGNATTFKLFMDVLGIECDIIHSTEEGEHAWNIVKIDGDWYHVDLTFDEGDKEPSYSRLNVTDDVKELDGYPWNPEDFHECTATKYNYGVQNAVDCEDVYAIPALLKKALDDGQETVYLKIPVPDGADATVFAGQLNCIADNQESERYVMYCSSPMIIDDGKALVAGFSVYDYDEGDYSSYEDVSADRADIDYSKVRKAFEKAFDGELSISEDAEDYENDAVYAAMYGYEIDEDDYS